MPEVRLQKAMADAGVASRRAAEAMIAAGRVTVDGQPATIGQRVDPTIQAVAVDGRRIGGIARHVYLALDKPIGVTATVSDRHAERTVVQLVPVELRRSVGRLFPVGRLDRDSEGLILLTNDGDWGQRLSHPSFGVEREYAVGLARALTTSEVAAILAGIPLDEGLARVVGLRDATLPETTKLTGATEQGPEGLTWYRVTLAQGWRRQLRRMFAAVGVPVARLVRVRIGTLRLDGMRVGEVRELSTAERDRLGRAAPAAEAGRATKRGLVVSLDGPASSGKSTVGAGAASIVGYRFCDTGLLYRAVTSLALDRGVDLADVDGLVALVAEVTLATDAEGRLTRVHVAGQDVTDRVQDRRVDRHVSTVAQLPEVRAALLPRQRELAEGGRIIMAGRDIGTVVLPDADLRLWLEVSVEERAERRAAERGLTLDSPEGAEVLAELRRRDEVDSTRAVAPLRIPDGAIIIRSDGRALDQTVAAMVAAIRAAEARAACEGGSGG
jgi:23S rRNA pseudouridine2605 synthase